MLQIIISIPPIKNNNKLIFDSFLTLKKYKNSLKFFQKYPKNKNINLKPQIRKIHSKFSPTLKNKSTQTTIKLLNLKLKNHY